MLDDMHKRKIDMADEIFVINVGGYIGESDYITLNVPPRAFSNVPLQIW